MKIYLDNSVKSFASKPKPVQDLINTTLFILDRFGVPAEMSGRRLERMAMAFLAVGDVKTLSDLNNIKDQSHSDLHAPKTREIIDYVNESYNEKISSGSYDDIRRKDLRLLLLGDIVLRSSPNSATNDSTRGYVVNPFYADLIRKFDTPSWGDMIEEKLESTESIKEKLAAKRNIEKIPVKLPSGQQLSFTSGEHNELQRAIIEEFLPRYGYGCEVLYVGDTSDKYLFLNSEKLTSLNFFELSHDELPDIIAYSENKNWLYLIEAVHSSGPIDQPRLIQLQALTKQAKCDIVFVTAFLTKDKFRSYAKDITWETEVWIAENEDHLVHFNGDKFLGPYESS